MINITFIKYQLPKLYFAKSFNGEKNWIMWAWRTLNILVTSIKLDNVPTVVLNAFKIL